MVTEPQAQHMSGALHPPHPFMLLPQVWSLGSKPNRQRFHTSSAGPAEELDWQGLQKQGHRGSA